MKKLQEFEHIDFKPFADLFRTIREHRNKSQEEAAHDLGMTLRYYQKLEKADGRPSFSAFGRMVTYFDVSVDELFRVKNGPKKSTLRLQVDSILDQLNDPGLIVMIATGEGLLKANECSSQKVEE